MRRGFAGDRIAVVLGVLALLWSGIAPGVAAASTPVAGGTPVPVPAVQWSPCPVLMAPDQECGTLTVPLDYAVPTGLTITIAVARIPATEPEQRIGSLIMNPGGPGGSGVASLPYLAAALPAEVAARFDLVSFDPRGAGQSSPVQCFESEAERAAFFAALPTFPTSPEELAYRQWAMADFAGRCGVWNGQLLFHLSTANVARDLDLLRQAVGDDQITYLGTSYGTYLGATYANLFPGQLRAMVLDGVIDPPTYALNDGTDSDISGVNSTAFLRLRSNEGSARALDSFFAVCAAAGPDACPFAAADAAATKVKFHRLMARMATAPQVIVGPAGTLVVTYPIVIDTIRRSLYSSANFSGLGAGLEALANGDAGGFLGATGALGLPPATEYRNGQEALAANYCLDADNPLDPNAFEAMAAAAEARTPFLGAVWSYLAQPCLYWPATDPARYTGPWDAETSATLLLISRVYDPAVPHTSALAAAETLANAELLTIDGWGNGFVAGGVSSCANAAMARYLIDLTLPAPGTICDEDAPPFGIPAASLPTSPRNAPAAATPVASPVATPGATPIASPVADPGATPLATPVAP